MKNENCDRKSTCDDYKYNHCDGCGANKPKGDLISRSALKDRLKELLKTEPSTLYGWGLRLAIEEIDNAPTVEPSLNLDNITDEEIEKFKTIWQRANSKGLLAINEDKPQGEIVIKCKDCKYQVKEWREDKRMKDKGFWVYGCSHFGEIMGYWGFGGNDNEFCSDAEPKGGAE